MLQVYSESDTFFNQLVGRRVKTALDLDGLFVPNGRFYVTLSVKDGEVQGLHVYTFHRKSSFRLVSWVTWVAKKFRGAGIAKKMWRYSLASAPLTGVEVCTASWEGAALVRGLQKRFPAYDWDVYTNGEVFE